MITRVELRRRWASLLGVAVLVALLTGAVLTAVAGAHRSATAVDRFRARTGANDTEYQSFAPGTSAELLATAESNPEVEVAALRHLVNVWPSDGSADIAIMSDPQDVYGRQIDRPFLLEGRIPASDAPDEVLLNQLAARVTGLHVGDVIEANTWSAADLEALSSGGVFPGFNGPHLSLEVVGVARTADEISGTLRRTAPYAIGSPAFLASYPTIGAWPPALVVALREGSDPALLDEAMSIVQQRAIGPAASGGFHVAGTSAGDVYLDAAHTATNSLVVGLVLFAAVAALAGGLAVGQAVQRQVAGSATPSSTLAALGLTRSEIARVHSWPIAIAAASGVAVGAGLAIAASPLLPIGLVRRAEVTPGVWVDALVLTVGCAVILATVCGWALFVAHRQARLASRAPALRRTSMTSRTASMIGSSPSIAAGLRMLSGRGGRSNTVPVRSAFVGVALAVTGVVAAGLLANSFHDLAATPSHWGVPWQSSPDYEGDASVDDLLTQLSGDDRVAAIGRYAASTMVLDGQVVASSSLQSVKGEMHLTELDGRLPVSPTEVAVGTKTLSDLGSSIGDTTSAVPSGGGDPVQLTIVGTVVLPATDGYTANVGVVVTPEATARFGQDSVGETPVLRYQDGADVAQVEAGLATDYGLEFNIFTEPRPHGSITSLSDPRDISIALAGFLVALAVVGLAHAILVSVRWRRHDLGVQRALGLRGRQAARAVLVEALLLTVAGLVVGVPLGFVAGRAVWDSLIADLGAVSDAQPPWLLAVALVPASLAAAFLVAWWPARRARSISPAEALRAE